MCHVPLINREVVHRDNIKEIQVVRENSGDNGGSHRPSVFIRFEEILKLDASTSPSTCVRLVIYELVTKSTVRADSVLNALELFVRRAAEFLFQLQNLNYVRRQIFQSQRFIDMFDIDTVIRIFSYSQQQMLGWLVARKYPYDSIDVEHIDEALTLKYLPPDVVQILELKQKLGGSAYKKFQSIQDRIGPDGRLRDQFVYHKAHTGRWAGRGVQLQNLFK